jgi:hypothetical protein
LLVGGWKLLGLRLINRDLVTDLFLYKGNVKVGEMFLGKKYFGGGFDLN